MNDDDKQTLSVMIINVTISPLFFFEMCNKLTYTILY